MGVAQRRFDGSMPQQFLNVADVRSVGRGTTEAEIDTILEALSAL